MHGDGNAGDIHQFEGSHTDGESTFGCLLDSGNVGNLLFQEASGFIEKRDEKSVDGKSGGVLEPNGGLSMQLGK